MFMLVFVSWGSIAASSVGQLWVSRDLWMPWRRQIMVTGSTQGTTNFRTTRPSWLTCFTLDMCSWISWISRLMQILDIHVYMFSLVFRLNLGQHYRHYIYIYKQSYESLYHPIPTCVAYFQGMNEWSEVTSTWAMIVSSGSSIAWWSCTSVQYQEVATLKSRLAMGRQAFCKDVFIHYFSDFNVRFLPAMNHI